MGRTAFEAYFFAADVFVGVLVPTAEAGSAENESIEKARAGRDWDESVVGYDLPRCILCFHQLKTTSRSYYVSGCNALHCPIS